MPYAHAQAPIRVGLAGGGTDLPAWTRERTGLCLNLAIAIYTHAVCILRPDKKVVASYRHLDTAQAATEIGNGLIRESALLHNFEDGFEVHTLSEMSSFGSGLGVSSSIAISLTACFSKMRQTLNRETNPISDTRRNILAEQAWTVEIDRLRRPIGRQDHMAAAHGGLRLYRFEEKIAAIERSFSEEEARWIARHIALLALPEGHDSRTILSTVTSPSPLQTAYDAVPIAVRAIEDRDPKLLGEAIRMGQASKNQISGAMTYALHRILEEVQTIPGVYGVKVAGAGGGGHLVIAYEPNALPKIEKTTQQKIQTVSPDLSGVRSEGWS